MGVRFNACRRRHLAALRLRRRPLEAEAWRASSCSSPIVWIMACRVAAEGRELMTWGSGGAGQEAQWVPHGIEHAYRDGDSVSLCGEKLSRL